jgi:lipopolysaccharide transport system ATP-binding protein
VIDIDIDRIGKRYRNRHGQPPRTLRTLARTRGHTDHWALKDVTLTLERGETFGVVGRNGSGKSTLLRVLAGVTRPTLGRVRLARRVSALLTLGEEMHPMLSGEENALTGAILAGLTRRQALRRIPEVAAFAELEDHMDQPLRTFSEGMRLRLAFSVAINVDPEILLIDEVLAVGDLRFTEKCLAHLGHLQDQGVTVVVASHDLRQVRMLAKRAMWLAEGRVRHVGESGSVVDRYERAMQEASPVRAGEPTGVHRRGSGEVEIADVRLLDDGGREVASITSGTPLTVVINYVAHVEVPSAIFGVSAHSEVDGLKCLDLSTEADGHEIGPLRGSGTIRLSLDRLDLAGGPYRFDVGVYEANWDRAYDYLWQAFPLEVRRPRSGGVLAPPHRWSMG